MFRSIKKITLGALVVAASALPQAAVARGANSVVSSAVASAPVSAVPSQGENVKYCTRYQRPNSRIMVDACGSKVELEARGLELTVKR